MRDNVTKRVTVTKFTFSNTKLADVFSKGLSSPGLEKKMSFNLGLINWFSRKQSSGDDHA